LYKDVLIQCRFGASGDTVEYSGDILIIPPLKEAQILLYLAKQVKVEIVEIF
jgi:hypothetical protein